MNMDITRGFANFLSRNRGPDPHDAERRVAPDYAVAATLIENVLAIALTFLSRRAYCCVEWGCHLGLHDAQRWDRFREALGSEGVVLPRRLRLRVTVVVEEGALVFDLSRPVHPGRYALAAAGACRYEADAQETEEG